MPRRKSIWPLGVVLLAAIGACWASSEHLIPIYDQEFVTLHVGSPGASVVFWLRWDASYISIRPSMDLQKFSRSYDPVSRTDRLCFSDHGCPRIRLNFGYGPHENVVEYADVHLPIAARNYHGILGLGPGSPVWKHFRYYSYTFNFLALSSKPFGAIARQRGEGDSLCVAGNFIPATINGSDVWAQVRLDIDYSFVPYPLAEATKSHSWRLSVMGSRREIKIDSNLIHERAYDGTVVSTLRPMSTRIMPNRSALSAVLSKDVSEEWHGNDIIVLGRYFFGPGFIVSGDVLSQQVVLSTQWIDRPWIVPSDYLPFYAVFVFLLVVWIFIMMQGSIMARNAAYIYDRLYTPQPNFGPANPAVLVGLFDAGAHEIPIPENLRLRNIDADIPDLVRQFNVGDDTEMSFRSAHYTGWLVFFSRLTAAVFSCCIIFGFGFMDQFWRYGFSDYDRAAFGSALVMLALYAAGIGNTTTMPATCIIWGQAMVLLQMWLAAGMSRFATGANIIMVVSSAVAAAYSTKQFIDAALGDLWPEKIYSRPAYRRIIWAVVTFVPAAWWWWICMFYSIPSICAYYGYVNDSAKWAVGALAAFPVIYWVKKARAAQFAINASLLFGVMARWHKIMASLRS